MSNENRNHAIDKMIEDLLALMNQPNDPNRTVSDSDLHFIIGFLQGSKHEN